MNSFITPRFFTVKTNFDQDIYDDCELWIKTLRVVVNGLLPEAPRLGDMVHDEAAGDYRNEGKAIFDGKEWQELDSVIDEYGALPPYISYPQFALGSYIDEIGHNCISWVTIDDEVLRQISELDVAWKTGYFGAYWYVVGTFLGKPVEWELDDLDPDNDDEIGYNPNDDTAAKACLESLRNVVAAHMDKKLALSFDGEQITEFNAVYKGFGYIMIHPQGCRDAEDF